MAKVEITKEQTVCDRCGSRVTKSGWLVQFIEGALKLWGMETTGVSFSAELCKACGDSLQHWWNKKAGEA